ncbi:MAG: lipocalin family protein [Chitinophagaceae bacterium]|nr:lipocalin family protein [Chitinophagaceae bacterium]
MKKVLIAALMLSGFAVVSCDKDDDNDDPVNAVDLITNGTWLIDTIAFDANKDGTIDSPVPGGFQACELDNTLTFNKDSATGVYDEGALKCDPGDPQSAGFEWMLKNNDSTMTITGDIPEELQGDVTILTLTNTQFILSKRISINVPPIVIDQNLIISLRK